MTKSILSFPVSDAADLVVQGKGKFEELMVCSHEIAASTAQLVAASKVGPVSDSLGYYKAWLGYRDSWTRELAPGTDGLFTAQ